MGAFDAALALAARRVEAVMDSLLAQSGGPESRLIEAMRYSALGGGKRFRPFLAMESAALFDVDPASADRVAAAIELLHCYSLVHDDLPAMDNSDLRRGRPSVHKAFDEATAILVGDGLLTLAFEVLTDPRTHPSSAVRSDLALHLAAAGGPRGMVAGQMLDLIAEGRPLSLEQISHLQRLKTGRVIAFACDSGAILGDAGEGERTALRRYAESLGLAFQIADDLLDAQGKTEATGKPTGLDAAAGKATFVSLLGSQQARLEAQRVAREAVQHLAIFGAKAEGLRSAARFVVERSA
jgi:farnesyl diphosphate synthase